MLYNTLTIRILELTDNEYDPGDVFAHPYKVDNWCEDIQEASGLDTSLEMALCSPPTTE